MPGPRETGRVLMEKERIRIEQHSAVGMLWFGAWLFTLGFLHLPFWKAVLALLVWPYYLGTTVSSLIQQP
jgi:hypothetical protein